MRNKTLLMLLLCASFAFLACGDDVSSADEKTPEETSSSVGDISSSSVIPDSDPVSSSSTGSLAKPSWAYLNPDINYGEMTDSRDGQVYKTVKIGSQVWMAENLNYADVVKTPSLKGNSWCYDNKEEKCDEFGRFYSWAAAIDSVALANDPENPQKCGYEEKCSLPAVVQGICPMGWHLPTYDEWQDLLTVAGGLVNAGKALKAGSSWNDGEYGASGNGTDELGFSAISVGRYDYDSEETGFAGFSALFWSATQAESLFNGLAHVMALFFDYDQANIGSGDMYNGHSIRCLQNSK